MVDRHIGVLFAIVFATSLTVTIPLTRAQTQTKPADQSEVVRLRTELVQVHVVITDKQGRVIDDLKKDDFELLEQGRPQEVSFFSLERVGVPSSRPNAPGENPAVNPPSRTPGAATPSRTILFFLDTLHLAGASLIRARLSVKQFVDERITDQDTVVIAASNGVFGIFQNAVRHRLALHRLIERINAFEASQQSNFTPYIAGMVKMGDRAAFDLAAQILASELRIDLVFARDMVRGKASEVLEIASYKRQSTLSVLSAVAERIFAIPGQRLLILLSEAAAVDRDSQTSGVQSALYPSVLCSESPRSAVVGFVRANLQSTRPTARFVACSGGWFDSI